MNQTITITMLDVDIELEIENVTITHDPGVWRDANGDGCPPSSEIHYDYDRADFRERVREALRESDVDCTFNEEVLDAQIEAKVEAAVNEADWSEWERDADERPGFDDVKDGLPG